MRIKRWLVIFNVVVWSFAGWMLGYSGYMRWVRIPRIQAQTQAMQHVRPCKQGMGESCHIEFALPLPKPTRDDF